MPVLNPPIARIYTPPTCTLEVTAQPSALSRWSRNPVVKSLDFTLSFEGLTRNARDAIALRGNQAQLVALSEAVTAYVQDLLAARYRDLPLRTEPLTIPATEMAIALRPQSLLTHELILGPLATEFSGPTVVLKVSQLYDLATALEDCAADMNQLPSPAAIPHQWSTNLLPLARSAALVLLTVGLGTATWRMLPLGQLAMNQSGRSPTTETKTAMAPAAPAPANKALPAPPVRPTGTLKLPTVQLPTRTDQALPTASSVDNTKAPTTDFFAGRSRSAPQSSAPALQIPSEPIVPLIPPEVVSLPQEDQAPNLENPQSIDTSPVASTAKRGTAPANIAGASVASPSAELSQTQAMGSAPTTPNTANDRDALFDTTPQVAEVRSYIASRWQPTDLPPKILEYRLTLNADGSLANVEPFGPLAQRYRDKLPLPSAQDPFVSAVGNGNTVIRLVVRPDGSVQTFLDSSRP